MRGTGRTILVNHDLAGPCLAPRERQKPSFLEKLGFSALLNQGDFGRGEVVEAVDDLVEGLLPLGSVRPLPSSG